MTDFNSTIPIKLSEFQDNIQNNTETLKSSIAASGSRSGQIIDKVDEVREYGETVLNTGFKKLSQIREISQNNLIGLDSALRREVEAIEDTQDQYANKIIGEALKDKNEIIQNLELLKQNKRNSKYNLLSMNIELPRIDNRIGI